ncbi:MAG: hypothetical protein AAF378_23005 [Cyanobacteria bacterium P01_A01_bin.84]
MRINLQRFTLSTLTFSLATTLAVGSFSESASARNPGSGYGSSQNLPALNFEVFLENEDGTAITDTENDTNLGVFKNAIEIINIPDSDILTNVPEGALEKNSGATIEGFPDPFGTQTFKFDNDRTPANLSAELTESDDKKLITYRIFLDNDDDYKQPDQFLKFAPVDVSSRSESDIKNLVNSLGFILDDSKEGRYDVTGLNNFKPEEVGVLGKAIGLSLRYSEEDNADDPNDPDEFKDDTDFLKITKFAPPSPSTSIPEPTTTLASIFALGFAGKFLRKSKKNNV